MNLVQALLVGNIKEVANRMATCDCMKQWQQQASRIAIFFINLSDTDKKNLCLFACTNRARVVELHMRK